MQGVGFRPLVYRLALNNGLNGYVRNDSNGLNVFFNAPASQAALFFAQIKQCAPPRATILRSALYRIADRTYPDFSILVAGEISAKEEDLTASEIIPDTSETDDTAAAKILKKQVLISPDIAICQVCLKELHDVGNRRYRYPFITCTQCGPRYSIINQLPYERQATAMHRFLMCKSCGREYADTADRRFFSQTNSCSDCGISLSLFENPAGLISNDNETVLVQIKEFLQQGKVLAVKGIGGYILLADAGNRQTIQRLRSRKHRPQKPFALLYPGLAEVQKDFHLNDQEREILESPAAPIMLLSPKATAFMELAVDDIAPGLARLGVMIPYNPLFDLIACDFARPLIATSANVSGSPIIYQEHDALSYLFDIADYVVSHNREISIPQDDSVIQLSKYSGQQIVLRRSRGYAPSLFNYKSSGSLCVLATGAFLKSTFSLAINGNVFVSQFLGSAESYESQVMYTNAINHWLQLYAIQPEMIVTDLHSGYFSHQFALEFAQKTGVKLKLVQHHEAHFAAVLAENNLLHRKDLYEKDVVLGVIWDGTGLGHDGHIWGGEFFKYTHNEMQRCGHFDYFPAVAGDKMAIEPRIAALCATKSVWPLSAALHELSDVQLREKFTAAEWNNYQSLMNSTNLFTSSAGRIFDAVASLLGVGDKQSYEGEAAMYLQHMAEEYVAINGFLMNGSYVEKELSSAVIPTAALMLGILTDIEKGEDRKYIAAKFHYSLVCVIGNVARKMNIDHICFSGGVFQNALLVDWIKCKYTGEYQLYFHADLSPNDENISFGQLVYGENNIQNNYHTML